MFETPISQAVIGGSVIGNLCKEKDFVHVRKDLHYERTKELTAFIQSTAPITVARRQYSAVQEMVAKNA